MFLKLLTGHYIPYWENITRKLKSHKFLRSNLILFSSFERSATASAPAGTKKGQAGGSGEGCHPLASSLQFLLPRRWSALPPPLMPRPDLSAVTHTRTHRTSSHHFTVLSLLGCSISMPMGHRLRPCSATVKRFDIYLTSSSTTELKREFFL